LNCFFFESRFRALAVMFFNVAELASCCGCDEASNIKQVEVVAAGKSWAASPHLYAYQPAHFHFQEEQCLDPLPCPKSPMKAMMGSPTPLRNGGSPRTPSWATPKQTKEVGEGTNFVVSIELTEPGNLGLDFETDDGLCIVSRVWDTGAIARWNESATEKVQQFDHLVTVDENSENLVSATSLSRLQERQGTVELHFRRPTWRLLEMAPNGEKLGIALARRQESGSILVRKVEPNGFIAQSGRMGQETLHVNDRIVAVNGVEGDVWQMAKQLLALSLLLKVCSH